MIRYLLLAAVVISLAHRGMLAGETVYAEETQGFFYADGKMKEDDPLYEITYYIDGDTVTRTRLYNVKTKEVIPDEIVYHIVRQMASDPSNGGSPLNGKSVIRAVGRPGADAIEILMISDKFVESIRSTSDYWVIRRLKRIK